MDNLEAVIKTAAELVLNGTGTYSYARDAEFNLEHDMPAPHIVFFDPSGRDGERVDSYTCTFMFVEPDPANATRESRDIIVTRMTGLAGKFFHELDKHDLLLMGDRLNRRLNKIMQGHYSGRGFECSITMPLRITCADLEA